MICFSNPFEVVFPLLVIIEREVKIDVKGPDKYFFAEIEGPVKVKGLFMVSELYFDYSVFIVDKHLGDVAVYLALPEEEEDHFVLHGLLHVLNY